MATNNILAFIATKEHDDFTIQPGNASLIRAKDEKEQDVLMREVALAVSGDVIKLRNGIYMIVSSR